MAGAQPVPQPAVAALVRIMVALALAVVAGPALAQTTAPLAAGSVSPSQVLTLDQERLFIESAYGQRVLHEIDAATRALAAENRRIEAQLAQEERDLTNRRVGLAAAEFRPLADAFDAKVVEIRRVQDEKLTALNGRGEKERQGFYRAAAPVLGDLVREAGAVVILDARAVFLSADRIDVTDEAIARVNQLLGEGPVAPALPQVPDPPDTDTGQGPPAPDPGPVPDPAPAP